MTFTVQEKGITVIGDSGASVFQGRLTDCPKETILSLNLGEAFIEIAPLEYEYKQLFDTVVETEEESAENEIYMAELEDRIITAYGKIESK